MAEGDYVSEARTKVPLAAIAVIINPINTNATHPGKDNAAFVKDLTDGL